MKHGRTFSTSKEMEKGGGGGGGNTTMTIPGTSLSAISSHDTDDM